MGNGVLWSILELAGGHVSSLLRLAVRWTFILVYTKLVSFLLVVEVPCGRYVWIRLIAYLLNRVIFQRSPFLVELRLGIFKMAAVCGSFLCRTPY